MIWFTADNHFGHRNIIKYSDRPFESTEEMDETMIRRWNECVAPDDVIYHLGDFALSRRTRVQELVSLLNGHKILTIGNHDRNKATMLAAGFDEVDDYGRIIYATDAADRTHELKLVHRPQYEGEGIVICGHVHEKWTWAFSGDIVNINVGVDQWGFAPLSMDFLLKMIALIKYGDEDNNTENEYNDKRGES